MPTSIPIPATAERQFLARARYRVEKLELGIALGSLTAWALAMLVIGAVANFGSDAALDAVNLIVAL